MKKNFHHSIAVAALFAAMATTACSSYEGIEDGNEGKTVRLTFTAQQEQDNGTRTAIDAIDSKRVNWQTDDRISVLTGISNHEFSLTSGAGTTTGTFTGSAGEAAAYTALYPYQPAAHLDNGILTATIPTVQTATVGSFDPNAALMMAVTDGNEKEFMFRNCVSYVKVTTDEATQSITFASLDGRSVAGTVAIDYNNGEPVATVSSGGSLSATLLPRQGETTIAAGTYYIAVLPQAMELGFKLAYVDADGVTHNRVYTGTKFNARRNKVNDMGTLNTGNTYTNRQIVYYADSKIGSFDSYAVVDASGDRIQLNNPGTKMTHEFKDGIGVLTFYKDVSCIEYLFYDHAQNITKVILPEALASISYYCFRQSQIEELYIPQSVSAISTAIITMPKLKKVVLPANSSIIKEGIISGCDAIQAVYGPYTNAEHNAIIKDNVLIYAAPGNLTSYTVPAGITRIGNTALGNPNLEHVTIPESVEEIGPSAFVLTKKLASIELPKSLKKIGDFAFNYSGITGITIPKSVQSLGRNCFYGATNLETVVFEDGSQIIEIPRYAFAHVKARFAVPASVKSIGNYAFYCYNAYNTTKTSIVIPDNVETIGSYTFYNAQNIESITLGTNVSKIGDYAFGGIWSEPKINDKETIPTDQQTNLKYIYSKNPTPPTLDNKAFKNTKMDDLTGIYVPAASVEAYKAAAVWSDYADKIKAME